MPVSGLAAGHQKQKRHFDVLVEETQDMEKRARGKRRKRSRVSPERYSNEYDPDSTLSDLEPVSPTRHCRSCTCSKSFKNKTDNNDGVVMR